MKQSKMRGTEPLEARHKAAALLVSGTAATDGLQSAMMLTSMFAFYFHAVEGKEWWNTHERSLADAFVDAMKNPQTVSPNDLLVRAGLPGAKTIVN